MINRILKLLFIWPIYFVIQSCADDSISSSHKHFGFDSIMEIGNGRLIKITMDDSMNLHIRPESVDSGKWKIELGENDKLIFKRLNENGRIVQDIFSIDNEDIHIKKTHIWDGVDSRYTLTSYLKWSELNSILEESNNLYATHILKGDTLEYMSLSYLKLFCPTFDDWRTVAEIYVTNNNGRLQLFSGVVEDYKRVDFVADCGGDWLVTSIIKRVDTIYSHIPENIRIQVVQDTIFSRFFVQ